MVIVTLESFFDILRWYSVAQDIVNSLYVKRLLDLCVRSDAEMQEN